MMILKVFWGSLGVTFGALGAVLLEISRLVSIDVENQSADIEANPPEFEDEIVFKKNGLVEYQKKWTARTKGLSLTSA